MMSSVYNNRITVAKVDFDTLEKTSLQNSDTHTIKPYWRQTLRNMNPIFRHRIIWISQGKRMSIIHIVWVIKCVHFNKNEKVLK